MAANATGISNNLTTQLTPYLKQSGDYYSAIAGGDPAAVSRATAPQVNLSRMAFDQAQKQIEMTAPKGGQRDQAVSDLQSRQAGTISSILTGGVSDAIAHLEGLGQYGTSTSLQGLGVSGNAGQSLAQLSAAKAQAVGQGISGLGSAVGMGLGGAGASAGKSSATTGGAVGVNPFSMTNPNNMGANSGTGIYTPVPYMSAPIQQVLTPPFAQFPIQPNAVPGGLQ